MKKYDLSKIFKRAWKLVKECGISISSGLKVAWSEAKAEKAEAEKKEVSVDQLISNIDKMAWNSIYINRGSDRRVRSKVWEKNGQKRNYLSLDCYTLCGNYKGSYKCGYVDMITNQYVVGKYDDVNAETMEYIGR